MRLALGPDTCADAVSERVWVVSRNGIRLARKMMETPAFSAVMSEELHPGLQAQVPTALYPPSSRATSVMWVYVPS